jgi:periplasmic protein TonB
MPLAYAIQAVIVAVLVLVPMLKMQALPPLILVDVPTVPAFTPHQSPIVGSPSKSTDQHATPNPFEAPPRIPPNIAQITDDQQPPSSGAPDFTGNLGSNSAGGPGPWVQRGVDWGKATPPPSPHTPDKPRVFRQGGDVTAARALYRPTPVYPRLALMAHIQGTVVLQAILGTDGSVQDLKVISGHPLLVGAALDAVRTWRYQPTLLNTVPVEVLTEIDVNFRLDE